MAAGKKTADEPEFGAPEDLSGLTDSELTELQDSLRTRAEDVAGADALGDTEIDEIERLTADVERITGEQTVRSEAAIARQARLDAALEKLRGPEAEAEVEQEAEQTDEGDGEPDESTPEVVAEVEPTEDDESTEAEAPVAIAASASARTAKAAPRPAPRSDMVTAPARGRLPQSRRPAAAAPTARPREFMRATNLAAHRKEGDELTSTFAVAQAIAETKIGWSRAGNTARGQRDYIPIATGHKGNFAHQLSADPIENFAVFQKLLGQFSERTDASGALVAAAGCPAPLTPLYDFYRTAVVQTPVEDDLPVTQAPRGGIRFIRSPNYTQALGAIGDFDNAEADPDDKPCLTVACPAEEQVYVTAVTKCVQFDNLEYRVFPELVEDFLEDAAVIFAMHKETKYLDVINATSTAVSSDPGYGASRSLIFSWTTAATQYRKRRQMRRGAMLKAYLPDWSMDLWKIDMAMSGYGGMDWYNITDQQVEGFLRSRGLDPVWLNDFASVAPNQLLRGAQAAGALNAWPLTVTGYLFAPGVYTRLDGGTLDVGLVRDSLLNAQNNLQLFYEEWNAVAMLGNESIRLTTTVCANGAAAALETAFTCP